MGSGCSTRGKSRKPTDDEYWERYAPKSTKPKEDENSNVQPILRGLERDLSRSLSKPSNEEISSNSNYEPQPQTKVKRVRHGIDWNDLEKNVQAMNLQLLREDLHENPERFLINQILLSVQFFKNFERDKEAFPQEKKDMDDKFNDTLRNCKRHSYVTDLIFQKVQENVGVQTNDDFDVLEPLLATNVFISYQSVEVNRLEDFHSLRNGSLDYSQADEPTYRVCIEENKKEIGQGKLRCVDEYFSRRCSEPRTPLVIQPIAPKENSDNADEEVENIESRPGYLLLKDLSSHIEKKTGKAPSLEVKPSKVSVPAPKSPKREENGGAESSSQSDDFYGSLHNVSLQEVVSKLKEKSHMAKLPKKCFKTIKVPLLTEDEDIELDDPYPLPTDLEEDKTYLTSKYFMQHFSATFYEMSRDLQMSDIATAASMDGPKIMCKNEMLDTDEAKESWLDFIPCVDVPFWPDCGIEWYMRQRKKFQHKPTGTVYHWPPSELTQGHIVQSIGANLIPLPAKNKVKADAKAGLNWKWGFVRMEHLLLKSLTHPQMRFYLFIIIMFRTHLRDKTGLDMTMLRYLFYWMLERDPASWQDETLGDKFVAYFKRLLTKVEKKDLPNYFIKKDNMALHLPKHKIAEAHARIFRIQENLVPHLIDAVVRLQNDGGFYPALDCEGLIEIISTENPILLVLPQTISNTYRQQQSVETTTSKSRIIDKTDKDDYQRRMEYKLERLKQIQKDKDFPDEDQVEDKKLQINLEMKVPTLGESRKKALLFFFVKHFINLIKKSNEFRAYGQSLMLVLQSQNMLKLLEEMGYQDTREYSDICIELERLRNICRVGAEGYWKVNWGYEDKEAVQKTSGISMSSFKVKQNLPLPDPPNKGNSSPIPGTETSEKDGATRHFVVEVHENNAETTEF